MKVRNLFIVTMGMFSFMSCQKDMVDNNDVSSGNVDFKMSIKATPSSKTTPNGEYGTTFVSGDAVGVFALERENVKFSNVKYLHTGEDDWMAGDNRIQIKETEVLDYYAYYPYTDKATFDQNFTTSVSTDQSAGYMENDFLLSGKISATEKGQTEVVLNYDHAFSLVEVTLKGDRVTEGTMVSLVNVKKNANIDIKSGEVATSGEANEEIIMYNVEGYKYRAIVPAQEFVANKNFIRIETNEAAFDVSNESTIALAKGKYTSMAIVIGDANPKVDISISNGTIADWGNRTEINDDDLVIDKEPIVKSIISPLASDVLTKWNKELTESNWYDFINDNYKAGKAEVTEETGTVWGKAAKLTFTSSADPKTGKILGNSYYIAPIGYYKADAVDISTNGIYMLTFKYKGFSTFKKEGEDKRDKVGIVLYLHEGQDKFAIGSNMDAVNKLNATTVSISNVDTDEWQNATIYVNFKKISSKLGSAEPGGFNDNTDVNNFFLKFYTKDDKTTADYPQRISEIFISDVEMVPYMPEN